MRRKRDRGEKKRKQRRNRREKRRRRKKDMNDKHTVERIPVELGLEFCY